MSDPQPTVRSDKRRRIMIKLVVMFMLFAVIGAVVAGYFLVGQKVWTDERLIEVAAGDARLRDVLWTRPLMERGVNTDGHEIEPALSPDGTEMFFVRGKPTAPGQRAGEEDTGADIFVSYRRNNRWTDPQPLTAVNTLANELGPRLSPDGSYLFFYSDRKGGLGQYDIWAAQRTEDGWGEPFNLGPQINSPYNEYGAAFTPDWKRFYFASNRKEASKLEPGGDIWRATIRETAVNLGNYDMYVADLAVAKQLDDKGVSGELQSRLLAAGGQASLKFEKAVEVEALTTEHHEGAPCVSPVGDFLYFSSNRPDGEGGFDIYRVRLGVDGELRDVENLGPQINTAANETDPQLAMRGFQLYFSTDREVYNRPPLELIEDKDIAVDDVVRELLHTHNHRVEGEFDSEIAPISYDIYFAESREVFADRQARASPTLAWSWWLLLAALLLLIPLLLFFRDIDSDKLSLLQKCLLISVIAHLILTLLFSFVAVVYEEELIALLEDEPMEIAVNLDMAREYEMRQEIREQVTELPTQAPALKATPKSAVRNTPAPPPQFKPLNLPPAQAQPSAIALPAAAPPVDTPTPTERFEAPAPSIHADLPTLDLQNPAERVAQAEAKVQPQAAQPNESARQQTNDRPTDASAQQVNLKTAATKATQQSLAKAGTQQQQVADAETVQSQATPKVNATLDVPTPAQPNQRLSADSTAPQATQAQANTSRVQTQTPQTKADSVDVNTPQSQVNPQSLANAENSTQPRTAPAATTAKADAPTLTDSPQLDAPDATAQALRDDTAAKPQASQAQANAARVQTQTQTTDAAQVNVNTPTADASSHSLADQATPQQNRTAEAPRADAAQPPTLTHAPSLSTPQPAAQPLANVASNNPSAKAADASASKTTTQTAQGQAKQIDAQTPTTKAIQESLASDSVKQPNFAPTPTASQTPVELPKLTDAPSLSAPQPTTQPVRTASSEAPTVGKSASNAPKVANAGATPSTAPAAVQVNTPSSAAAAQSLAKADAPATPTPNASNPQVQNTLPKLAAAPSLTDPTPNTGKVEAQADASPQANAAQANASRVNTNTASANASAKATDVNLNTPTTSQSNNSLAKPTNAQARVADATTQSAVPLDLPTLDAPPALNGPTPSGSPIQAASADAPKATEADAQASRVTPSDTTNTTAQAATVDVNVPASGSAATTDSALAQAAAAAARVAKANDAPALDAPDFTPTFDLTEPQPSGAPVKAAGKPAPVVAESSPDSNRLTTTAGPNAKPTDVKVTAPSTRPTPDSLAVAASLKPTPAKTPAPNVAIDIPVPETSAKLDIPTQASMRRENEAQPFASATEAEPPLKRQPLSIKPPTNRLQDELRPSLDNEPVRTQLASLAKRATDNLLRAQAIDISNDPDAPAPTLDLVLAIAGPGDLQIPELFHQRSAEERKKVIDDLGGNKASENAVARALKWLADNQEPAGRWANFNGGGKPGNRRFNRKTDTAITGLAALAFLGADHAPNKPGPYKETVTAAIEWLIKHQKQNGDLRNGGDMYAQGIATIAVAEAALMSRDPRYREAALKAAEFIVKAQHKQGGGWRYQPGDKGDTSVFGWQIMALHAAEQLGYPLDEKVNKRSATWLRYATKKNTLLSGYTGPSPTPTMTAEAIFSRMLLGETFDDRPLREACQYLLREPPGRGTDNYYYWYYASLMLRQLDNESWEVWNAKMRDYLVKRQDTKGDLAGSWNPRSRWAERGGRVCSTALATLSLEVYYRYSGLYRGKSAFDANEIAAKP